LFHQKAEDDHMANGTTIDEDQQEQFGQDYRPPNPMATQAAPPAQPPIVAPAPATPARPAFDAQAIRQADAMRKMLLEMGDTPLAEAEKAVDAALKFQAQRGYQKDLAGGMSAADALTKWGPTLFGSHVGTAQALSRVAARPAPRPVIVGGRAFAPMNPAMPGAPLQPITPGAAPKADQFDLQTHGAITKHILELETKMNDLPVEDRGPIIRQIRRLQQQADEIKAGGARKVIPPPTAAPAPTALRVPAATPASNAKRVRVRSKAGKVGTIPADQLAQALAEGYTRVQ
jgi:hypothetical protein